MQLWHLTFSSDRRHVLFPAEGVRRRALRKMFDLVGAELVLYCLVDDHLHLVVLCDEARAVALRRAIHQALRALCNQPIDTDKRPVEGRSHLTWLLRYHLLQVEKHGLKVHPALWEGSCFQDLAGARCIVDLRPRLDAVLPRLEPFTPHALVGLPRREILPSTTAQVRAAGVVRLARAAGTSLMAQPGMKGRGAVEHLGKRAVAQLAAGSGIPSSELVWLFKQDSSSISRWRRTPVPPEIARAVRVRLALEDLVTSMSLEQRVVATEPEGGAENARKMA